MKTLSTEIICPTCNGVGHFVVSVDFPEPDKDKLPEKVKLLRQQGLSLRKIGKRLGIKNPGTVDYYLKK